MEHINHLTKKQYQGDSPKLLTFAKHRSNFNSSEWMTAYQASQRDYKLKPDQKGTRLYRIVELKETRKDKKLQQALIEYYWVFNLNQFVKNNLMAKD